MYELLKWLQSNQASIVIFDAFQERAQILIEREPNKAALLRLLSSIIGQYSEYSYGEPVSVDRSAYVLADLIRFIERAVALDPSYPHLHLDLLNEIGTINLARYSQLSDMEG